MGNALNVNHAGALHALQQQANTVINATTKEDVDRLGSENAAINATTVAGLNHHEKKFLVRAANYYQLAYPLSVEIITPVPTEATANIIQEASSEDVEFKVTWNRPVTHVTAGDFANVALTFENGANNQNCSLTSGNGTTEWTMSYSSQAEDYANTTLAFTNSNIALNGGTCVDAKGRAAGLDLQAPDNIDRITITDA